MSDSSDSEDEMVPGLVAASNGHEVMDVENGGGGDVGDGVDDDDDDDGDDDDDDDDDTWFWSICNVIPFFGRSRSSPRLKVTRLPSC